MLSPFLPFIQTLNAEVAEVAEDAEDAKVRRGNPWLPNSGIIFKPRNL
jgi:hypothetical protein